MSYLESPTWTFKGVSNGDPQGVQGCVGLCVVYSIGDPSEFAQKWQVLVDHGISAWIFEQLRDSTVQKYPFHLQNQPSIR